MKVSSHAKLDCEMHACLRQTMRIARWAGMFPVQGLNKPGIGELRFNIKSFYIFYYSLTIFLQTIMTGFTLYGFFSSKITLASVSLLVFYVTGLTSGLLLLNLAYEWPRLMFRAASIERQVTVIRVTKLRIVKATTVTYIVLISAAVEHVLSLVNKVKNVYLCDDGHHHSWKVFLETYFSHLYPFVFSFIPINIVTVAIICLIQVQATFLWNFTDVMIMCFSMYLILYFQDLNRLVNSQINEKTQDWEQLRIYYSKLVTLVQAVDSRTCYLILLSIITNLCFICLQLYYTLNYGILVIGNCPVLLQQEKKYIDKIVNLFYYAFSVSFLVIRATTMLFLAANVNTAANEPKYALSAASHTDYNIHVQRFSRQIRYTTTALSGVFFYVTRRMILKVYATILTYELVLLQFNKN